MVRVVLSATQHEHECQNAIENANENANVFEIVIETVLFPVFQTRNK
jgi:hypothetical protein